MPTKDGALNSCKVINGSAALNSRDKEKCSVQTKLEIDEVGTQVLTAELRLYNTQEHTGPATSFNDLKHFLMQSDVFP